MSKTRDYSRIVFDFVPRSNAAETIVSPRRLFTPVSRASTFFLYFLQMFVTELGRSKRQRQRPGKQHQRGMAQEVTRASHRADQGTALAHAVRQGSDIRITDAQRAARLDRRLHEKLVGHNLTKYVFSYCYCFGLVC